MSIYMNGTTITSANTAMSIAVNDNIGLTFSSDIPVQPDRPCFIAQGTWTTWVSVTNAWATANLNYVVLDTTSSYNTSNYRFTAPVSGTYYLYGHLYGNKDTSTNADSYVLPMFMVNGSTTVKAASSTSPYRLRGRTYTAGAYSFDTRINDIYYLTANDYVEYYVYYGGTLKYYAPYSMFGGFLIG